MPDATYIVLRRNFDWENGDKPMIEGLCDIALNTKTRLIVQDYAGNIINQHYPLATFGPPLLKKVLFDFTYQEGGCFIDFSKINILMRPDGTFLQPAHEPIAAAFHRMEPTQRIFMIKSRTNTVYCYVKRLHSVQSGTEEYRDWCTADVVYRMMGPLTAIYGTPHSTDNSALEKLMVAYLHDLCNTLGDYMSADAALALAKKPGKEYQETLEMLKEVLLYQ